MLPAFPLKRSASIPSRAVRPWNPPCCRQQRRRRCRPHARPRSAPSGPSRIGRDSSGIRESTLVFLSLNALSLRESLPVRAHDGEAPRREHARYFVAVDAIPNPPLTLVLTGSASPLPPKVAG